MKTIEVDDVAGSRCRRRRAVVFVLQPSEQLFTCCTSVSQFLNISRENKVSFAVFHALN
jgi:hypothetical protein